MRKYLIVTHGSFAGGILSSFELIAGKTDNVFIIEAYTDGNKSIDDKVEEITGMLNDEDELIVFTDLVGGSVTNQIIKKALQKNVYIISGINLPLILEIILADAGDPVEEIIERGIASAREQIIFVNNLIKPAND
ncbi:MAG: hypothetical protein LBV26_03005 [Bacteroidales bacterium]|jgi:mannose/fructose-specific phosphotransferase system component IIA|nr:hypothetical protein [Bacteroidales bacterium]